MLESILVEVEDTNGYMNFTTDFKNLNNMEKNVFFCCYRKFFVHLQSEIY